MRMWPNWTADRLCWSMSPKHDWCSWYLQNAVVIAEPGGDVSRTPFRSNGNLPIYGFQGLASAAFLIEQQLKTNIPG